MGWHVNQLRRPVPTRDFSRVASEVHAVRFWHQTSDWMAVSSRHVDATMDQMMVTQLIE